MINQKVQLLDLETDLWEQCNLRCAQCTHSSPYFTAFDEYYKLDKFKEDLTNLSRIAHINTFRIVGGEPLLNKKLFDYVKFIKEINITDNLTIFTNGLVLGHLNNHIFPYIDRLRISVYTNLEEKKLKAIYSNINKIKEYYPHLDVISNEISYFSYFNLIEENKDPTLVKKIYDNCYYSYEHRGFSIFNGRFFKCFASRKKYKYLHAHQKDVPHLKDNTHDSLSIETLTAEELESFINNKDPLEGCKWCLGTCGKQLPHSQIKEEEDVATIKDLSFEDGEIYLSNLLLSWDKAQNYVKYDKFFKQEHIEHYNKHFL